MKGATGAKCHPNDPFNLFSIHAPVKGATRLDPGYRHENRIFNPRTREGCDFAAACLPSSGRLFNPRTREGCDENFFNHKATPFHFSIHAPVKGATR